MTEPSIAGERGKNKKEKRVMVFNDVFPHYEAGGCNTNYHNCTPATDAEAAAFRAKRGEKAAK